MESKPHALGKILPRSIVETAAVRFGDREAIFCSATGRRFTFRAVNERANRLANALLQLGLAKGSVVGFLCSNRAEMAEIYFALAKTGIVGMPLNYRLAAPEISALLQSTGATTLIVEGRFRAGADHARQTVPALRHCVWIGAERPSGCLDYEGLLADASDAQPMTQIEEADPFYFNLTSGTTGLPKCYVLTHFNAATALNFFIEYGLHCRDVVLTVVPVFGRIGMTWIAAGLMYGVRHVLMNFEPAEALRLIESEAVTVTNLVPTMGAMLLASQELPRRSTASLRAIIYAGSNLPAPIREQTMARLCPQLYEYYGMQEAGALVLSNPEDRQRQPDSVGRITFFSDIRIVGAGDRPMPVGEIGQILGRSPAAVTAYFQDPAKTAETFRDGWIHTGDLGRLDEQGYLFICGRTKDMIITGGQNVHAAEVEETLLMIPGVIECAVIGLPDDTWGECVSAVVIAAAGTALELGAVQDFCRTRLAGFKIPRRLFVEQASLPRTATGKVQKFLLIERYQAKP